MWGTSLAIMNAFIALILSIYAIRYVRRGPVIGRGLKIATALIGLYWCALYVWVAIVPAGIVDPIWFGQVFVRPAFTVTLAVMAGGAIYRWRSYD